MDDRLMVNQPINPAGRTAPRTTESDRKQSQKKDGASFEEILKKNLESKTGVNFSRHAQNRIKSREINISENELEKLQDAVQKAEDKGARDSLVMVDQVAYVVSVENKTVITAMNGEDMQENVFTNIDSAVFM
ncbi:MAG: TIGR02530 family flagellar biosynthesis protein [Bacillota bacterium]